MAWERFRLRQEHHLVASADGRGRLILLTIPMVSGLMSGVRTCRMNDPFRCDQYLQLRRPLNKKEPKRAHDLAHHENRDPE